MLKQLMEEIKLSHSDGNIIYIDKELEEFAKIRNSEDLHLYVMDKLLEGKDNFLFIDEVQEIESFQPCLRSLLNQRKCDIYCTGSNATMLSGELATLLAGCHKVSRADIQGLKIFEVGEKFYFEDLGLVTASDHSIIVGI
jgi:predicted AAA+ superfamily ATPase